MDTKTALQPASANGQGLSLRLEDVFSPAEADLLRKTIIPKDATPQEVQLFTRLCNQYGLDPFNKEIWFLKYSGRPLIMTSRDGYLKICLRDPEFSGVSSCAIREGDEFELDPTEGRIRHKFGAKRGPIIGAWAIAKHRRRDPVIQFADFSEYDKGGSKGGDVWRNYPSAMICKVAEVMALKRQGGISGLVTEEEAGSGLLHPPVSSGSSDPAPYLPQSLQTDEEQIKELQAQIFKMRGTLGFDADGFKAWQDERGLSKPETLAEYQAFATAMEDAILERERGDVFEEASDADFTPDEPAETVDTETGEVTPDEEIADLMQHISILKTDIEPDAKHRQTMEGNWRKQAGVPQETLCNVEQLRQYRDWLVKWRDKE